LLRLSQHDLKCLMEFLRQMYALQTLDSFRKNVLTGLQQLVPSDIAAYNEVNLRTQHNQVIYDRPEAMNLRDGAQIFDRYIPEHPLIAYSRRRRGHGAVKISDFVSAAQYHRLGLYNEFFRLIGIEDQMVMSLPSCRPVLIGIALNRSRRNFKERERLLLNLAYPHLIEAYANAEAWTRMTGRLKVVNQAVRESSAAIILLNSKGRVEVITPKAISLIGKYLGGHGLLGDVLPDLLQRWIARQEKQQVDPSEVPPPREPLIVQLKETQLAVRLFEHLGEHLLFMKESSAVPEGIDAFGLTRRESVVLLWISRGKTNKDIAAILGTSPRTIQKHVEHIFRKLGVETRTAAASKALTLGSIEAQN